MKGKREIQHKEHQTRAGSTDEIAAFPLQVGGPEVERVVATGQVPKKKK